MRLRCEASPKVLSHGEDYILYAILDFIVDNYMPVLESVEQEVEEIEDHVVATALSQSETGAIARPDSGHDGRRH